MKKALLITSFVAASIFGFATIRMANNQAGTAGIQLENVESLSDPEDPFTLECDAQPSGMGRCWYPVYAGGDLYHGEFLGCTFVGRPQSTCVGTNLGFGH